MLCDLIRIESTTLRFHMTNYSNNRDKCYQTSDWKSLPSNISFFNTLFLQQCNLFKIRDPSLLFIYSSDNVNKLVCPQQRHLNHNLTTGTRVH